MKLNKTLVRPVYTYWNMYVSKTWTVTAGND